MGSYSSKSRREVVDAMAKKLAVRTRENTGRKKGNIFWWIFGCSAVILFLTSAVIFTGPKLKQFGRHPSTAENPFSKITSAFEEHRIVVDEYVLLLDCIMVKYDSLPSQYKVTYPVIDTREVIDALVKVMPQLQIDTRDKVCTDIPLLKSLTAPKAADRNN
jgi:hypothetical protein